MTNYSRGLNLNPDNYACKPSSLAYCFPSISLDPNSESWIDVQKILGHGKAFERLLTNIMLSEVNFKTNSKPSGSWRNLGDLLIATLSAETKCLEDIPSTSTLAIDPLNQPWIMTLRGFLRESFIMRSDRRPLTIDTHLGWRVGAGEVITIKSTIPPKLSYEIDFPNSGQQTGSRSFSRVPPQWQHLENWLHHQSFFFHPVWSTLTAEWTSRQQRYRRLFSIYCAEVCFDCTSGGCCHSRFPKLIDIITFRIQHGSFPLVNLRENSSCRFLSSIGCSLLPGPLPSICIDFHCSSVLNRAPKQMRGLLPFLAEDANRIRRTFATLWRHLIPIPPLLANKGWNSSVEDYLYS